MKQPLFKQMPVYISYIKTTSGCRRKRDQSPKLLPSNRPGWKCCFIGTSKSIYNIHLMQTSVIFPRSDVQLTHSTLAPLCSQNKHSLTGKKQMCIFLSKAVCGLDVPRGFSAFSSIIKEILFLMYNK